MLTYPPYLGHKAVSASSQARSLRARTASSPSRAAAMCSHFRTSSSCGLKRPYTFATIAVLACPSCAAATSIGTHAHWRKSVGRRVADSLRRRLRAHCTPHGVRRWRANGRCRGREAHPEARHGDKMALHVGPRSLAHHAFAVTRFRLGAARAPSWKARPHRSGGGPVRRSFHPGPVNKRLQRAERLGELRRSHL